MKMTRMGLVVSAGEKGGDWEKWDSMKTMASGQAAYCTVVMLPRQRKVEWQA